MKRVKRLAAGAVLLIAALLLSGSSTIAPPYKAVRMITNADGAQRCSAVVIKPGMAYTARHCLDEGGIYVDGHRVEEAITYRATTPDVAVIFAPGLECPCADVGVSPAVGDQTLAVGFAGTLNGEYRITEVGTVKHVGPLNVFAPWIGEENGDFATAQYIITNPIIEPGDSGGALFSMQNGEWRLVGITSIGLYEPASCVPFFGCATLLASGFVPVEQVDVLLRR
jgi:S1-C subfamily serine protease